MMLVWLVVVFCVAVLFWFSSEVLVSSRLVYLDVFYIGFVFLICMLCFFDVVMMM